MEEASELEMCVDVKMDTREKHMDYLNVRTWTKFLLKIQPIKCFPCHLRISLIHDHKEEVSANMTIKINVPGISVQMASSRKKQHICSLSWTYNQRCTIFLSFDTQLSCQQHVQWLRRAIRDLEQYSLALIESKRLSRSSMVDEVCQQRTPSLYENIWETRGMRSYGDCQRDSRTSGIYEEIPDARRNAPRASIASGIYEEMLPVDEKKPSDAETDQMPPPLPPRTRINTAEGEIPRSFTNPESEMMKKKRYRALFDGFLGLGRRTSKTEKKGKKTASPSSLTNKFLSLDISQGKRNSFSSPNLTKLTRSVSESDAMTPYPTSLSDDFWCNESYINTVSSQPETKTRFDEGVGEEGGGLRKSSMGSLLQLPDLEGLPTRHIRQNSMDCRIGSSQEMSPRSSQESQKEDTSVSGVFNSIYFKFQDDKPRGASESSTTSTLSAIPTPTNTEGYLEMGPIGFNRDKVRELDRMEAMAKPDLSGYVEMTGNGFSPEAVKELDRLEAAQKDVCDSPAPSQSPPRHEESSHDADTERAKRLSSFDEKIPSYFPNENVIVRKSKRRLQKSPEVSRHVKSLSNGDFQVAKRKPAVRMGSFSRRDTPQRAIMRPTEAPPDPPESPASAATTENRLEVQSIADKCVTLSRLNRCSLRADLQSGLRRFASLPRFRKLDLTPLKAKITSALQRQNT
ncbi:uncharacterized protein LOC129791841 [Lutzomyia longipalpis]|uniref:uncharacterized protein LOC129791841 n=1 Tax=Lutzomyia longipalpis TaxID=7200 RepID=UPI002484237F|nr:uncharacterized protein LOC129791841 [Lutzomyia longipalpis]